MNSGSIGEIPPSTRVMAGRSAAMAWQAPMIICAKAHQSGSCSRSQCERLFGSFQSMTASSMVYGNGRLRGSGGGGTGAVGLVHQVQFLIDVSGERLGHISAANSQIGESGRPHILGLIEIPPIEKDSRAHGVPKAPQIESAELAPFGDQDQSIGVLGYVVGIRTVLNALYREAGILRGLWIIGRHGGSFGQQLAGDVDR